MRLSIAHTERRFVNTLGATALVYALVAGQCADVITTLVFADATDESGGRAFPHLEEGNPWLKPLVDAGAWWDIIAIKGLTTVFMATVILGMARSPKLIYRIGAVVGGAITAALTWDVVLHNLRYMGAL